MAVALNRKVARKIFETYAFCETSGQHTRGLLINNYRGHFKMPNNVDIVLEIDRELLVGLLKKSVE
jgi:inosine-uridine nucleoside N-ribohydrolase